MSRMDPQLVALELPQWWYVEFSSKGAFKATKVEDAHYRNYEAMRERRAVGYEPIGLFPSLDAALEHIRDLKRMRSEQRHDEERQQFDSVVGPGAEDSGAEYPGV